MYHPPRRRVIHLVDVQHRRVVHRKAIEIDVPVAAVPPSTAAQGRSKDAAIATLPKDANATKAVGEWKVVVNGARGGSVPGLPAGDPSGTLALLAETWTPELTPVVK
jgi:hypothetical protein